MVTVLRKVLLLALVVIGISFLAFLVEDGKTGDIVVMIAGDEATAADLERIRHEMGLDRNVIVRYANYISNLCLGDMGMFYWTR